MESTPEVNPRTLRDERELRVSGSPADWKLFVAHRMNFNFCQRSPRKLFVCCVWKSGNHAGYKLRMQMSMRGQLDLVS